MPRFQNKATGLFLDSKPNGNVFASERDGGDYQNWIIETDESGSRFRNVATGRYLDSNENGDCYSHPLHGGTNQTWHIEGSHIVNHQSGQHLDVDYEGKLYTLNRNDGNFQKWIQLQ